MVKKSAFSFCLLISLMLISADLVSAIEKRPADRLTDARYSMAGIRLGAWIDEGDKIVSGSVTADFPDASFYTELFYDYRFTPVIMLELSLGVVSRGDATFFVGNDRYIGTINLYPMLLQVKLSPLAGRSRNFHPFLIAGGGIVYGKHNTDVIIGTGSYIYPDLVEDSETSFLYVFGGGIDIPFSEQIGMTVTGKYHPIDFGDSLAEITDYSGLAISVGIAYYLHKK